MYKNKLWATKLNYFFGLSQLVMTQMTRMSAGWGKRSQWFLREDFQSSALRIGVRWGTFTWTSSEGCGNTNCRFDGECSVIFGHLLLESPRMGKELWISDRRESIAGASRKNWFYRGICLKFNDKQVIILVLSWWEVFVAPVLKNMRIDNFWLAEIRTVQNYSFHFYKLQRRWYL